MCTCIMSGGGRTEYYMIEGYIIEITMRLSCILYNEWWWSYCVYYMIEGYIIQITMRLSCILYNEWWWLYCILYDRRIYY